MRINTPSTDGGKISSLSKTAITVGGVCSLTGTAVSITGAATGTANCVAGSWSTTLDFSNAPDGTVQIQATQNGFDIAIRTFLKDAAFCDNATNAAASPFAGGSGTPADPYLICTRAQLEQIANYLSGNFRLRNDFDLSGPDWTPISPFSGTIDGYGFVIKNMTYTNYGWPNGFFAQSSGTITNMALVNVNLVGYCHQGALVGIQNVGGSISNSYSTGSINTNGDRVGGLVGQNYGDITNSYSTVNITWVPTNPTWNDEFGGLVGEHNSGTISSSYATGSITTTGTTYNIGGLVGGNNSTIQDSYATGTISAAPGTNVGGFVGSNNASGSIARTFSTGAVTGSTSGGFAGVNNGSITSSYWATDLSGLSSSAGGTGLTSTQMANQSNLSTWDFLTPIWKFVAGTVYPVLTWQ